MPSWKNTDSIDSIPAFLSDADKRRAVRTNRGWEVPLRGDGRTGGFELLVAMNQDGLVTRDTPEVSATNDSPYFISPGAVAETTGITHGTALAPGQTFATGSGTGAAFGFVFNWPDEVLDGADSGHFQTGITSGRHIRYYLTQTYPYTIDETTKQVNGTNVEDCFSLICQFHNAAGGHVAALGGSGDFNSAGIEGVTAANAVLPSGGTSNAVAVIRQEGKTGGGPMAYLGAVVFEGASACVVVNPGLSAWRGITFA